MNSETEKFVFLKTDLKTGRFKNKLYQAVTFRINDYLYVNSKILFLLMV